MYPKEYIEYLIHFHGDRDYFECHEILEEYWKETDSRNKESILVGFILLAVSNYHHRRSNYKGAQRTLNKAFSIFIQHREDLAKYGLRSEDFIPFLENCMIKIKNLEEYKSYNLPIHDPQLVDACIQACNERGFNWCQSSDLANFDLIHRHSTRDRSEVIADRKKALKVKQNKGRE
ncbi:DUF309 domain-containing protein [Cytobacillus sp. FJAT-54145]|uniref:DUF309 domain-containing protein n=1 Tax=Cytobacillus spartinae TaxID=3299023 RepID=A0ABW6KEF0_9BACI